MARGGSKAGASRGKPERPSSSSTKAKARDNDSQPTLKASSVSKDLQQKCLDIFRIAFRPSSEDATLLQEVKGNLYNRDFAKAFGNDEYLRVYASRWSPSRALAYLQVFEDIEDQMRPIVPLNGDEEASAFNVACVGGGAGGELVALSGWLSARNRLSRAKTHLQADLLDIADWSSVIGSLREGVTSPPELSQYASKAKKDANRALIHSNDLSVNFYQHDVLASADQPTKSSIAKADLVTFMFTLNELYSTSMVKTQNLLSNTMTAMRPGTHLLVVDSPGSYSTVSINGAKKKYPMQWLLDYTLRGSSEKLIEAESNWNRSISDDSRWFRLPEGLEYPIELENMRYQIHLYRKSDAAPE